MYREVPTPPLPRWLSGKASASGAEDTGIVPCCRPLSHTSNACAYQDSCQTILPHRGTYFRHFDVFQSWSGFCCRVCPRCFRTTKDRLDCNLSQCNSLHNWRALNDQTVLISNLPCGTTQKKNPNQTTSLLKC